MPVSECAPGACLVCLAPSDRDRCHCITGTRKHRQVPVCAQHPTVPKAQFACVCIYIYVHVLIHSFVVDMYAKETNRQTNKSYIYIYTHAYTHYTYLHLEYGFTLRGLLQDPKEPWPANAPHRSERPSKERCRPNCGSPEYGLLLRNLF